MPSIHRVAPLTRERARDLGGMTDTILTNLRRVRENHLRRVGDYNQTDGQILIEEAAVIQLAADLIHELASASGIQPEPYKAEAAIPLHRNRNPYGSSEAAIRDRRDALVVGRKRLERGPRIRREEDFK